MNWSVFIILLGSAIGWTHTEKIEAIAESPAWLNLMHYERTLLGGYKSRATGEQFFFAPTGRTNPLVELESAVQAFRTHQVTDGLPLPVCRFPARARFLKSVGLIESIPPATCQEYQKYREVLSAKSVTLVFSSYFMGNPGSAFGHTFLRMNRAAIGAKKEERFDLIDTGISYGAEVTTTNPIAYMLYGLFGGFDGIFNSTPYYLKVREYNDSEARDLWEYDLNLSQDQVDFLVDHLWELGQTRYTYYFLSENCSFQLLAALDAVNPDFRFVDQTKFYVIPADTLKTVVQTPELNGAFKFRPAGQKVYEQRLSELLVPSDESHIEAIIQRPYDQSGIKGLPDARRIQILDAAIDGYDLKHRDAIDAKEDSPAKIRKRELLVARSRIPTPSQAIQVPLQEQDRPDLGHSSARFHLGLGQFSEGFNSVMGMRLGIRFALHDELDWSVGYPRDAQIEVGGLDFEFRSQGTRRFRFQDLTVLRVAAYNPLNVRGRLPVSFRFKLGGKAFYHDRCLGCFGPGMEGALGGSFRLLNWPSVDVIGLLAGEIGYGGKFILGGGPGAGALIRFWKGLAFRAEIFQKYYVLQKPAGVWDVSGELRFAPATTWAMGLLGKANTYQKIGLVQSYFYF